MADKIWVNLPQNSGKKQGRLYFLEVKLKEKKPGDSDGQIVYLFLEPDGKNMSGKMLGSGERASGFHFKPPNRKLVTVKNKKASAYVRLSLAGGDKFKFKAGKKVDKSGAKDAQVEVEVWRKIFVRLGKMAGMPTGNLGTVKSELQKVFIEMEQEGPSEIPHEPWSRDVSPITDTNDGKPAMTFPDQSTTMVFVDRIGKSSRADAHSLTWTPAELAANKVWSWKLPAGLYTWPAAAWVAGRIEFLNSKGEVTTRYDNAHDIMRKSATGAYTHPEGLAATKIKFDFSNWPSLGPWIKAGKGTLRIKFWVWIIDDTAMGLAWPSPPQILIATRHPISYDPSNTLENTVVHELGHNLGLNVRWLPEYNEASGAWEDWVQNATWYDNRNGGVGTHCSTGASLDASNKYKSGSCTMLHYVNGVTAFCAQCTQNLKRADLKKLGKGNVWPNG